MKSKRLFAALLAATTVMFIAGCASNQAIKTTDGKTIVTDGEQQPKSL
ncbi:YgdI/YgdR family lipoprotein, partial [Serratia sp. CY74664]